MNSKSMIIVGTRYRKMAMKRGLMSRVVGYQFQNQAKKIHQATDIGAITATNLLNQSLTHFAYLG